MNIKKKIKAGVIGLGVGAHQARLLSCHPDCDLVAISDFDEDKLRKIGSEFPQTEQTQDAHTVLSNPEIDLVCIASYDQYHYDQVITGLNNGKHISR